ncbi:Hypothetical protein SCF082_LOCUS6143 [Durusdinium trenchii]|uniref:Methyltransferase FkbM domain-containing protein n=1 Tax=Durusdinium trenchii TaxID=1381693 RepID=A0ABP0IAJ9_9DINO
MNQTSIPAERPAVAAPESKELKVPWCRHAESKVQEGEYPACLVPPSKDLYRLAHPKNDWYSQDKQDQEVWPLLKGLTKGFFIESGASVGEAFSNTLALEKTGKWSGLLVEPDPWNHELIATLHRKAYLFKGCLSGTQSQETLWFKADRDKALHGNFGMDGRLMDKPPEKETKQTLDAAIAVLCRFDALGWGWSWMSVTCLPLKDILEAVGHLEVDFWSLDIEGAEGAVLEATDFSKVKVGVMTIEMNKGPVNNKKISDVMEKNGFVRWKVLKFDQIFVNPSYIRQKGWEIPADDAKLAEIMNKKL